MKTMKSGTPVTDRRPMTDSAPRTEAGKLRNAAGYHTQSCPVWDHYSAKCLCGTTDAILAIEYEAAALQRGAIEAAYDEPTPAALDSATDPAWRRLDDGPRLNVEEEVESRDSATKPQPAPHQDWCRLNPAHKGPCHEHIDEPTAASTGAVELLAEALWTAEANKELTVRYRVTAHDSRWEAAAEALLAASPALRAALERKPEVRIGWRVPR